ncbi:MAG: hypothetical protein RI930_71 [Pseudomonadota bacterium]|jgi:hypothetical protein
MVDKKMKEIRTAILGIYDELSLKNIIQKLEQLKRLEQWKDFLISEKKIQDSLDYHNTKRETQDCLHWYRWAIRNNLQALKNDNGNFVETVIAKYSSFKEKKL